MERLYLIRGGVGEVDEVVGCDCDFVDEAVGEAVCGGGEDLLHRCVFVDLELAVVSFC